MPSLVLPVHPVLAYRWSRGELGDAELIHRSDLVRGSGLFIVSLRSPAEYRQCVAQAHAIGHGLCTVLRTRIPSLQHYIERRWGMVATWADQDGARRYWAGAEATRAWIRRAGLLVSASDSHKIGR
jgi:hypothetical protein